MGKKKSKGKARPAAPTAAEEAGFKAAQDLQAEAGRKGLDAFREISSPAAAARDAMAAGLMSPNPLGDPTDTRRAQRQYLSTIMDVGLNERNTHGNGDQSHLIAGMPSDPAFQLRNLWSTGLDYNPLNPSNGYTPFCAACWCGVLHGRSGVTELIGAAHEAGGDQAVHLLINR